MSPQVPKQLDAPILPLKHSNQDEFCNALRRTEYNGFWWYLETHAGGKRFSLPFRIDDGSWWYQVKPGLCWPVDVLQPRSQMPSLPYAKSFLGFQFAAQENLANSQQIINTIENPKEYGTTSITSKRRGKVRKGLRSCCMEAISSLDESLGMECADLWNGFVKRTGWKKPLNAAFFERSWRELLVLPGTNILIARSRETGDIAGFLISKIIGSTAFVDTIAGNTRLLALNVNDALMYTFVQSAKQIAPVSKIHYAIKSYDKALEVFKKGIGYSDTVYPSHVHFRPGVGLALRVLSPKNYGRMIGTY